MKQRAENNKETSKLKLVSLKDQRNDRLMKTKRNSQITKVRNEIGDIITYLTEIRDSKVIT